MGRRKAPRLGIDPGPAPGRHIDPLAVAIGRPVGVHIARVPDVAVFGNVLPVAVVVELLVADHFARDVARRDRLLFDAIALGHPALEGVVAGAHWATAHRRQIAPRYRELLARAERHRFAAFAIERGAAGGNGHARGAGSRVGLDAIVAGGVDHHGKVAGVDLEALARQLVAHAQLQAALLRRDARGVVVEFGHRDAGLVVQAQRGGAHVQFGAGIAVGPEAVAGGDRPVRDHVVPAVVAGRREADGALMEIEAGHAARRILLGKGRKPGEEQRQTQQPAGRAAAGRRGGAVFHGSFPS